MQRGTILIWGYTSTKRLRTPVVEDKNKLEITFMHLFNLAASSLSFDQVLIIVNYELTSKDESKAKMFYLI
jgi:hypothetical protein